MMLAFHLHLSHAGAEMAIAAVVSLCLIILIGALFTPKE